LQHKQNLRCLARLKWS